MQENLREMVQNLTQRIPNTGIFLWNDIPHNENSSLTRHTILSNKAVFEPRGTNPSIAQWMLDAVNGKVASYGLDLLNS